MQPEPAARNGAGRTTRLLLLANLRPPHFLQPKRCLHPLQLFNILFSAVCIPRSAICGIMCYRAYLASRRIGGGG